MSKKEPYFFLHGNRSSILISASIGASPRILYWGERLPDDADQYAVSTLLARQGVQGGSVIEVPVTLSCEPGSGYAAPYGLEAHRDGLDWAIRLKTQAVDVDGSTLNIQCSDENTKVAAYYQIALDPDTDVIKFQTRIENNGNTPLTLDWAASACFPLPAQLNEIIRFDGKWANEFQTNRLSLGGHSLIIENLKGRTSHDHFPGLIFCTKETTENAGSSLGVHLGWSGNHRMRVDTLSDGRRVLQLGERFHPGEMRLAPGSSHDAPPLYAQFAPDGLSAMSQGFHDYYRTKLCADRTKGRPRPVHYNSWEAIYFDHDQEQLEKLVDQAAELGVERFVLDDGWFKGRRNDRSGLGDWQVDPLVYPSGLQPLIDKVIKKDMEFGLWVEPEMVNKDSDLFRAHPDWIVGGSPSEQVPFRNQYVIDLTCREAFDNIFTQIDNLLTQYPDITYLKWDMNRDLNHPSSSAGYAIAALQTRAVYALIDKLRHRHKHIEIESCSSGGGRTDFGILQRTDRLWTSDSNDALDRQSIQKGASYFFPLEILGSHVGPSVCKITGRTLSMGLRSQTAMFGAMGVEANLLTMSEEDRDDLKAAIALFKEHRHLIHDGNFFRIDGPEYQNTVGVVSRDKSTALFAYVQLSSMTETLPPLLRFPGLDPDQTYRLKVTWPNRLLTPPPFRLENSGLLTEGYKASGTLLEKVGLQLPLLNPETGIIFHATAIS